VVEGGSERGRHLNPPSQKRKKKKAPTKKKFESIKSNVFS
jgi:hypothetical protein